MIKDEKERKEAEKIIDEIFPINSQYAGYKNKVKKLKRRLLGK